MRRAQSVTLLLGRGGVHVSHESGPDGRITFLSSRKNLPW